MLTAVIFNEKYKNLRKAHTAMPVRDIFTDNWEVFDFFTYQTTNASSLKSDYKVDNLKSIEKKSELFNIINTKIFNSKLIVFTEEKLDNSVIAENELTDDAFTATLSKGFILRNKTNSGYQHGLNSFLTAIRNSLAHNRISTENGFLILENTSDKDYEKDKKDENGKPIIGSHKVIVTRLVLKITDLTATMNCIKDYFATQKREKEKKT
jgi:hypothetical protein